jgi:hypothetical protein
VSKLATSVRYRKLGNSISASDRRFLEGRSGLAIKVSQSGCATAVGLAALDRTS